MTGSLINLWILAKLYQLKKAVWDLTNEGGVGLMLNSG